VPLPPLANLFALHSPDPRVRAQVAERLVANGYGEVVTYPAGWVVGIEDLPESASHAKELLDGGLVFAEGRDAVLAAEPGVRVRERALRRPETLAELPGDFTFFAMDNQELIAARSCGGLVPVYVWQSRDRLAVSTRIAHIIRLAGWSGEVDPLPAVIIASGLPVFPERRTVATGIRIAGKGEWLRLAPGSEPSFGRYWDPQPREWPRTSPELARERQQRFRSLLLQQMEENLDPAGRNLLLFSGGVDSSSLLALTTGTLSIRTNTWSLVPPEDDAGRQHELSYVESLVRRYKVGLAWQAPASPDTYRRLLAPNRCRDFPLAPFSQRELPEIMARTPIRVVYGGELADELVGSDKFNLPDWVNAHSLSDALLAARRFKRWKRLLWCVLQKTSGTWKVRPPVVLPGTAPAWTVPSIAEELAALRRREQAAARSLPLPNRVLYQRLRDLDFQSAYWEAACTLSVRRFFPFAGRRMLELCLGAHPDELLGDGSKTLARRALVADVPVTHLGRTDKGAFEAPWTRERFDSGFLPAASIALQQGNVVSGDWAHRHRARLSWAQLLQLASVGLALELVRSGPTP
jgi:asparagine synthetase B (glutamine-hydrolysing)